MVYILLVISVIVLLLLHVYQRYLEFFPAEQTKIYRPPNAFIITTIRKNIFRKKGGLRPEKSTKWKLSMVKGFKNFSLSFGIDTLFFAIMQTWLTISSYSGLAATTILQIEERLHSLKKATDLFTKYKFWPDLALIALLAGLASSWPFIENLKLKEYYKKAMTWIGLVIGILTIAVSFSFYGNEISKNETWIKVNLKCL